MCSFKQVLLYALVGFTQAQILNLQEGESCEVRGGGRGICSKLRACRDPGDFRREQPPICSFIGREPVICCPKSITTRQSPGLKAAQYCAKASDLPHCSGLLVREKRRSTIFGGVNSRPKDRTYMNEADIERILPKDQPIIYVVLPENKQEDVQGLLRSSDLNELISKQIHRSYLVLIGYGPENNKNWGCGGSLISAKYVLSAAHCSSPALLGVAKWARLGDLDISTNADDARIQDREIAERINHPDYKEPKVYNDIALFRLNLEVQFTPWVAPVCLHTQRTIQEAVATVTGWGRIEFAGETSDHLLEADLDVYNDTECQRLLPYVDDKTPRAIDSQVMFCAGKSDGSKDACSGDSGGPLVVRSGSQCLRTQIGITSYGSMCGLPDSPGVYTRVANYIAWIEDIVFPDL